MEEETGVKAALMVDMTVGERNKVGVGIFDGVIIEVGERFVDIFDWVMPIFLPKFTPTKKTATILRKKMRKMVPLAIFK